MIVTIWVTQEATPQGALRDSDGMIPDQRAGRRRLAIRPFECRLCKFLCRVTIMIVIVVCCVWLVSAVITAISLVTSEPDPNDRCDALPEDSANDGPYLVIPGESGTIYLRRA